MKPRSASLSWVGLVPVLALAGCGLFDDGGGGGSSATQFESEPNEGIQFSDPILIGRPMQGDVVEPEDEDWFSLKLTQGRTVQVELFGTRLDQSSWEAAATVPRLSVVFPLEEDILVEHSFSSGWVGAAQDFDLPIFHVTRTGTYWFVIRADTDLAPGGRYALRVTNVSPAPNLSEIETALETGIDDTPGTAQSISPGVLAGFHRDGNDDFYSLEIPGPRVVRAEVVSARNGAWEAATSVYDPLLRLYDVDGSTILEENDDAFFRDPAVQFEVAGGGTYRIQVTQNPASTEGAPYVLKISTDPASAITESEPNDTTTEADALAYGQSVSGVTAPGVEDWYRFTGTAGDMVRLQVFDIDNSQSAVEPLDAVLFAPDGTTPLAFNEGPSLQVLTTILQEDGTFYVRARSGTTAVGASAYRLELRLFHSAVYESEPNDTVAEAGEFPGGGFAAGAITAAGDRDLHHFTASSKQLVVFAVYASSTATGTNGFAEYSGHGSVLAPLLTIRDVTGAAVATSTSQPAGGTYTEGILEGLPTAAVAFVASPTADDYYIEVAAADGTGSLAHTYVLQKR